MARPVTITKSLTAASATAIAAAQTLAAAGNFTLTGTTVTLDSQRRVLLTFAGDETGHTFSIYGYNDSGGPIREDIAGTTAGTVASTFDFKTVTRVYCASATTGNVSVGTNTVGSTRWVVSNPHLSPTNIDLVAKLLSGSGAAAIEYTADDFVTPPGVQAALNNLDAMTAPTAIVHPGMQNMTSGVTDGEIDKPITGWRLTINSGTGTWQVVGLQAGISEA